MYVLKFKCVFRYGSDTLYYACRRRTHTLSIDLILATKLRRKWPSINYIVSKLAIFEPLAPPPCRLFYQVMSM